MILGGLGLILGALHGTQLRFGGHDTHVGSIWCFEKSLEDILFIIHYDCAAVRGPQAPPIIVNRDTSRNVQGFHENVTSLY